MSIYLCKKECEEKKKIALDDMILTADMHTTAGSKMLENYNSLVESEAVSRLKNAGYAIAGKVNVGEFAIDLLGETSYFGANFEKGVLENASALAIKDGAFAVVGLDVNGAPRRAAAQSGLVAVKSTYGLISRYGTIPVACSGETVSVMANTVADCKEVISVISGYDDKDGTSIPTVMAMEGKAQAVKKNKVAVLSSMLSGIDEKVSVQIKKTVLALENGGIKVDSVDCSAIASAGAAWNILMSAELCNNVSRYDGVKYGYRAANFTSIDELYVNTRTQAFGELLKSAILFGSETLATGKYMKVYDKALRVRRVIVDELNKLFNEYDAVIIPACSALEYTKETVEGDKYLAFKENFYTAPASITGMPSVTVNGVQLMGKAFNDEILLELASAVEKESK